MIPGKRVSLDGIKIGMLRDEVVAILGKPDHVSAKGNTENLHYDESSLYIGVLGIFGEPHGGRDLEVRIVDGKVESFGEEDEFSEEPEPDDDN